MRTMSDINSNSSDLKTLFDLEKKIFILERDNEELKRKNGELESSTTLTRQTQRERWIYIALFISVFYDVVTGGSVVLQGTTLFDKSVLGLAGDLWMLIMTSMSVVNVVIAVLVLAVLISKKEAKL